GSGKTVLTSGETATFFFPQFADPTPLSAETTLRSILRQSLDLVKLSDEWESQLAELDRMPSSDMDLLTTLLRQIFRQTKIFYVFIDGLDEFEPTTRRALLESLASIDSESRFRVFLSSRESLSGELKDRVPSIATVSMASTQAMADIGIFVKETLQERRRNGDLNVENASIIDDVQQALINRADGIHFAIIRLLKGLGERYCADQNDLIRCSAMKGDLDLLDALLDGISTDETTLVSALYKASGHGQVEVVNRLIAKGANVKKGALRAASAHDHAEFVKLLLSAGADVNMEDLEEALGDDRIEIFTSLSLAAGADVKNRVLNRASIKGQTEAVKALLSVGADANLGALHSASREGHIEIIKLFILAGADVRARSIFGRGQYTPLQVADQAGGKEAIVRLLRDAGAQW
ncbi:ankyrin repeat-containing protein, partial [Colletotrichum sojae]